MLKKLYNTMLWCVGGLTILCWAFSIHNVYGFDAELGISGQQKMTNSSQIKVRKYFNHDIYIFGSYERLQGENHGVKFPEFNTVALGSGIEMDGQIVDFFVEAGVYVPLGTTRTDWSSPDVMASQVNTVNQQLSGMVEPKPHIHWAYSIHELNPGIGFEIGVRKVFDITKYFDVGLTLSYRYLKLENHLELHNNEWDQLPYDAWWETDFDTNFSGPRVGLFLRW